MIQESQEERSLGRHRNPGREKHIEKGGKQIVLNATKSTHGIYQNGNIDDLGGCYFVE